MKDSKKVAKDLYKAYRKNGMSEPDSKERLGSILVLAPEEYPMEVLYEILEEIENEETVNEMS